MRSESIDRGARWPLRVSVLTEPALRRWVLDISPGQRRQLTNHCAALAAVSRCTRGRPGQSQSIG